MELRQRKKMRLQGYDYGRAGYYFITLPEQVDAHQHVERAQPQVPDDLHPLDGVDVVVTPTAW